MSRSPPISFGIAAELAPPQWQGRYLGVVTAGLTVSLIVGVPLGTLIGGTVGWRYSFLLVAVLGVVALVGAAATVPTVKPEPLISLRERLLPLRNPAIGLTIAGLVISGAGGMMVYVYLAPVSRTLAGATPVELALLIAVFGLSGMFGAVLGGAGADRINGGAGKDRLAGGAGKDRVSGGSGNDRISGGSGNDRLSGKSGNDRLSGGLGNDRLSGGSGNDRLVGGPGRDRLRGGPGRDRTKR